MDFYKIAENKRHSWLVKNKKMYIDIIYTFDNEDQQFIEVLIPKPKSDIEFFKSIVKGLSKARLKHLIRISTCSHYCYKLPSFIANRNGKYDANNIKYFLNLKN